MTQLSNQDSNVAAPQTLTSAADYTALLDRYDTFLLDCDGVIWAGPNLIPKVKVVLDLLRSKGGSSVPPDGCMT
jgi:4-nitrophenyl phosphatase